MFAADAAGQRSPVPDCAGCNSAVAVAPPAVEHHLLSRWACEALPFLHGGTAPWVQPWLASYGHGGQQLLSLSRVLLAPALGV
jgi:hypothetical protein